MKSTMLALLEKILRYMAITLLTVHRPKIVAITGSVGKTSAKSAIATVLASKFSIRENQKNYNNEIGIPLTIIGADSGGNNLFLWIWVLVKWIFAIINPLYPKILILELGVDRPNDMTYFMSFIHPEISVVTNVSQSHIEFFKTIDNIAKEKRVIVESLDPSGFAILNADDERVSQMAEKTNGQVLSFGFGEGAAVQASNLVYNYQDGKPEGISFKLSYQGTSIPVRLNNILAGHYVYAALAAVSVGIASKMNLVDIASALGSLEAPVGRMNLLEGINGSYIIDDTYNASPTSTVAALDVLEHVAKQRKVAILGDMLELGQQSEIGHKEVARKVHSAQVDLFVGVGDRMQFAAAELIALGYPAKKIMTFNDPDEAGDLVREAIRPGDYILVKGSQGMRMEKIVEKLLKNPDEAEEKLCRQTDAWKRIPFRPQ